MFLSPYFFISSSESKYSFVSSSISFFLSSDICSIFTTAIFESFVDVLTIIEPEKESKYLTHLANFDNNDQILISNWENDDWTLSKKSIDVLGNTYVKPEDEVKAIILKLYTALPPNVSTNSTFWITKTHGAT